MINGFLLLCLMLVGCLPLAPSPPLRGELHGELYWSGEVRLAGDVVVSEDAFLTIAPGTIVRFVADSSDLLQDHPNFPGSELIVRGRISAVGSPAAPIIFRADDELALPGAWGAVNIEGSSAALFRYCVFRQADSAIHSRDARLSVEQSLFENNRVGIRFNNSRIHIVNNLLRNNQSAIRFHLGAPVIHNNRFAGNRINLFVTSHPQDYRIEANHFGPAREYQVVLGEEVPEDIHLAKNYWEDVESGQFDSLFYDGQRSDYLGRVLVDPVMVDPPADAGLQWNP
ncbi:MAG: hypothetical protein C0614_08270 [Desulfuromonas sp.]|nr:MAG: hypothetical protein C0614_08270 [Desulfuromonas sp.]